MATADIVVAHVDARLIDPHVVVGLSAGDGGVASWSASVGIMRAKRHLLTGDPITARDAHGWGLITDLVEDATAVRDLALGIAKRIAKLSPIAVQGTKRAFVQLVRDYGAGAFENSLRAEMACLDTEDLREAIAAIREKRKPVYRGK